MLVGCYVIYQPLHVLVLWMLCTTWVNTHFNLRKNYILQSAFSLPSSLDVVWGETVVNMRKVTHQVVQVPLSGTAVLPCIFTLRPSPSHESHDAPRVKWTKIWGHHGLDGLQREQSVLVAKGNVVKVKKAFQGRVILPGYTENRYNASLALTGLRSSDSGMYRCEVVVGLNDEQDTVPLQVTGESALQNACVYPCLWSDVSLLPQGAFRSEESYLHLYSTVLSISDLLSLLFSLM